MDDWQVALKKILEERERKRAEIDSGAVIAPKKPGTKKNRGLGAYPLLRPKPKVRFPPAKDDGLEVYNWRRSPMEN